MGNTSKNIVVILGFLALILIAIFAPLISVWSINTIFGLNIAYTFSTWFAAFWLSAVTIAPKFTSK